MGDALSVPFIVSCIEGIGFMFPLKQLFWMVFVNVLNCTAFTLRVYMYLP